MPDLPNPESRVEQYLANLTDGTTEIPKEPESRIEQYLDYLCENGGAGVNYGTAPAAAVGKALVAKTIVDGKVTEWEFGDAGGLKIHICTNNEYSLAGVPTIASPDEKTLYLVPDASGTSPNLFVEWAYVNDAWEQFGSASIGNIPDSVNEWLTEHITNPDNPPLDRSLTSSSAAAPADLVGEELTNLKQDLSEISKAQKIETVSGYIANNQNTGSTVPSLTPSASSSGYYCAVVECVAGDSFVISGYAGSTARLWSFIDSSNKMLAKSAANANVDNLIIKAPTGTAKLILNGIFVAFRGETVSNQIADLQGQIDGIISSEPKTDITGSFAFSPGMIDADQFSSDYGNATIPTSTNLKRSNYVDVSGYALIEITAIVRKETNTSRSGLCFYNANKQPLIGYYYVDSSISEGEGYSEIKRLPVPVDAKYIRTTLYTDDSTVGHNTIPFTCYGMGCKPVIGNLQLLTNDITGLFAFESGQIIGDISDVNYGQAISSQSEFQCSGYVDISSFKAVKMTTIVRPYSSSAHTGLCFYDENKQVVSGYFYLDNSVSSGEGYTVIKNFAVPNTAKYVRTTIYQDSSTIGTNTVPFMCAEGDNAEPKLLFNTVEPKKIEEVIHISNLPQHDFDFIDDNLWVFINSGTSNNLKIYDSSFNLVTQKTVSMSFDNNPFKFKSVHYNKDNGCLMIGTGDGVGGVANDYYLYIFYEADTWADISGTITFENCGAYTVIDFSDMIYSDYSTYGFWVSNNKIIVTCGKDIDIYEVQLGIGSVDLGNGTYAYIDDNKYNGTYRVINKWTKGDATDTEIRENPYTVHGGTYYNGHLYFANSNKLECSVYKVNLKADNSYEIDVLDFAQYMNSTTLKKKYAFLDGMTIHDGYIYSHPLYVDGTDETSANSCLIKALV